MNLIPNILSQQNTDLRQFYQFAAGASGQCANTASKFPRMPCGLGM